MYSFLKLCDEYVIYANIYVIFLSISQYFFYALNAFMHFQLIILLIA